MKKIMFKMITTFIIFFLVLTVGKRILIVQSDKMGGDFNKAVECIKEGNYIDAVMAFTGDLNGIDENIIPSEARDEAKDLIEENKEKNVFDTLKGMFFDMEGSIDKITE